jgi:predicted transcriptional regulator
MEGLELKARAAGGELEREIKGGYASDLLSDVIAHSRAGDLWITLQVHQNIVAVASLKDLAGIIVVNGIEPDRDTLAKAEAEKIPILVTPLSAFEVAGRLYQKGISGQREGQKS